ncbi:MAG: hypothetical protein CVU03_01025 [Bacteroidetes bacterium HGW-Bacteroidetes-2]|jgi:hypothetical protein|nr:MAG: hypothetical protein CVU03_01025 [Bacteroidetes bacterium HGW-Bacteroidetes-2]
MKKLMLIAAIAVFGLSAVQAQEEGFKIGVNFGLPVGDIDDVSSFNAGLDLSYMFDIVDSFQVGPSVGYSHFFLKSEFSDFDDIQFLPLSASARFFASEDLFFGANLGYALGIDDGNDGGFYYRPNVGYNLGPVALILSYQGVSVDGFTSSSINLGVEIGL